MRDIKQQGTLFWESTAPMPLISVVRVNYREKSGYLSIGSSHNLILRQSKAVCCSLVHPNSWSFFVCQWFRMFSKVANEFTIVTCKSEKRFDLSTVFKLRKVSNSLQFLRIWFHSVRCHYMS